ILLPGAPAPSGPLRRRAELESLSNDVPAGQTALARADAALVETVRRLADLEVTLESASQAADLAREAERVAVAAREDAIRNATSSGRELGEAELQLTLLRERIERS